MVYYLTIESFFRPIFLTPFPIEPSFFIVHLPFSAPLCVCLQGRNKLIHRHICDAGTVQGDKVFRIRALIRLFLLGIIPSVGIRYIDAKGFPFFSGSGRNDICFRKIQNRCAGTRNIVIQDKLHLDIYSWVFIVNEHRIAAKFFY